MIKGWLQTRNEQWEITGKDSISRWCGEWALSRETVTEGFSIVHIKFPGANVRKYAGRELVEQMCTGVLRCACMPRCAPVTNTGTKRPT